VGVQEVRGDREGTVRAEDYNLFYGKGNNNHKSLFQKLTWNQPIIPQHKLQYMQ
jgi:hypothetical protein